MSVYHRMLGRELPCNVLELLDLHPMPLPGSEHEALAAQAGRGYPDVLYRLGLSHLGRQELGLARQRLTDAVAIKPAFARARLALAAVEDLLAQHDRALQQLDAVLALEPQSPQEAAQRPVPAIPNSRYAILCAVGFCLERRGDWQAAAGRYHEALDNDPTDLFAHYRLAAIFLAHSDLEHAAEHHQAILEQQPQEQAVRVSLAHLWQLMGKHQQAVWEYEKACCLEPDSWELQVELAEELALAGRDEDAIDHLKELVAKQPHFPDLRLRLANLYSDRGEDELAVAQYQAALSLHGDYLDCRIALARHELKRRRVDSAIRHFQAAIAVNDQNVEAYVGLALAMHKVGRADRARETLAAAGKIAGNSDILLVQLGLLEMKSDLDAPPGDRLTGAGEQQPIQQQWVEDQLARYELALEANPTWVDVRVRYGMLLRMLGRCKEAIAQFTRATTQNPALGEAWIGLGLASEQSGDMPGAMRAVQEAIRLRPGSADLHYRLGLIHCGQMEFGLALEQMEQGTAAGGGNPDLRRQLWAAMESLRLTGRCAKATASAAVAAQTA